MAYEYNEGVATADVCVDVVADSLEELFNDFALATEKVMVENLDEVKTSIMKVVSFEQADVETLLFKFLSELIFYKDADQLIFSKFEFDFGKGLSVKMYGEKLDPKKHDFGVDIKAVTKHQFYVKKVDNLWKGRVILDI